MNPDIRIAVCTNRTPRAIADCLAALQAQAGADSVTVVTSGLSEAEVDAHRAAFGGAVLAEPQPGLSRARNRALECADGEVLAFVDDDAVVEDGWWEALRRRWSEAPADVACIGGPIRPLYSAERPPWFSDGIAHTLTLLDRGSRVRDLDPDEEAVYGANISFRAAPLRELGGFDPDLGHSGGRIFFAEEDEVQRALRRRGLRVRYVPDVAVRHVIGAERLTRRSFIRRRFAFGTVLGMRRGRPRALAARQLLASAAGALGATLLRRQPLAMERAVRAAENAGVLYGSTRPRLIA
jgi:GT2 family glycosyltransferase